MTKEQLLKNNKIQVDIQIHDAEIRILEAVKVQINDYLDNVIYHTKKSKSSIVGTKYEQIKRDIRLHQ